MRKHLTIRIKSIMNRINILIINELALVIFITNPKTIWSYIGKALNYAYWYHISHI